MTPSLETYALDDFRQRVARLEAFGCGAETGDYLVNEDVEDAIRAQAKKQAAVLIGVREAGGELQVTLTQRTAALRTHSGQIAFPGGRIDADDDGPVAAALRECEEETGIGKDHIEVLGRLPDYLSGSGFRIHPIIGQFHPGYEVRPNPDEVARLFDVPLRFLMDQANHTLASRDFKGKQRYYYEMPFGDRYIWGVTAGIIRVLYERLYR